MGKDHSKKPATLAAANDPIKKLKSKEVWLSQRTILVLTCL